jgi:hypothetical protein
MSRSVSDKLPACVWLAARWLFDDKRADDLELKEDLDATRAEIDTSIAAMLRGDKAALQTVRSLCAGAVMLREITPGAKAWLVLTAPLRAPACTNAYNWACAWAEGKYGHIRHLALSLAHAADRRLPAAQALWIT